MTARISILQTNTHHKLIHSVVPLLHHPAPHPVLQSETRGRYKPHPTPHTMCYGHQPPYLTKTLSHTCKYKAVIDPSTPPRHYAVTAQYLYAPHVYRIEPLLLGKTDPPRTGSHLSRSIIQRHSSLPRTTGFQEFGTPCRPRTLVHHLIDIIRSSDMYTYTVKVLEISTSKS